MPALAQRLADVQVSASAAMTARARDMQLRGIKVISLASGEPDFPTPRHAIEAAYQAALAGDTKYPPQGGTEALKEAIQRKFKRDNNLDYALDEIIVCNGGKQAIFNAFMATIDPGDEVVIPAPYWISYADMAKVAGGRPVLVNCPQNNGFKLRPQDLDAAITPKTKWVMLNFPNNPTGYTPGRRRAKRSSPRSATPPKPASTSWPSRTTRTSRCSSRIPCTSPCSDACAGFTSGCCP